MANKYKTDTQKMFNHYIACLDLDFSWNENSLNKVIRYWNSGYHIDEISKKVKRKIDEVAILIIDLKRKGEIDTRIGGVFGTKV